MTYRDLTRWENRRRQHELDEFIALVCDYFNNTETSYSIATRHYENAESARRRPAIAARSVRIHRIIAQAGVPARMSWSPPPMIGGRDRSVDLIHNMFGLNRFSIPPNEVLDCLYRARGVYESDETGALLRTFNPLWWMKKVFVSFIQIPFSLFRVAGFDTTGIEASIFGKLVELIVGFITLAAAVLAIVNLLGGIDWLKAALGIDASFWRNL